MTDDEQLNLLAVFHSIVGAITALFSCLFLLHVAMGIAMLTGDFFGPQQGGPPKVFAWFFVLFPAFFVLCGWTLGGLIIAAGRRLKRRASYSFCIAIAALECMLMPLGTVLGVFTIIALHRESTKRLFAAQAAPPHAS